MLKTHGKNIYPRSDKSRYMREWRLKRKHPGITDEEIMSRITAQERWRRKEMAKPNSRMRFRKLVDQAKWRANRDNIPFEISVDDIISIFTEGNECPVLGIPMYFNFGGKGPADNSPSLDRLIPELGYVPGNIAIISYRANMLKRGASLKELRAIVLWMEKQIENRRAYA